MNAAAVQVQKTQGGYTDKLIIHDSRKDSFVILVHNEAHMLGSGVVLLMCSGVLDHESYVVLMHAANGQPYAAGS